MATTSQTKVMIIDDHSIMREGLQEVLKHSCGLEVVDQARDGVEAVETAQRLKPDVIIMDIMMPLKNGIDACREIVDALPDTRVLMLTASNDEDVVVKAVAAGAMGYLQKYSGKEKLLAAIQDVVEGEFWVSGDVIRRVFARMGTPSESSDTAESDRLTTREREILKLFAEGMSHAEIAETRGNRPLTVRNAIYRIRDKLGTKSKQEMVVWAVRNGLLDNDPVQRSSPTIPAQKA